MGLSIRGGGGFGLGGWVWDRERGVKVSEAGMVAMLEVKWRGMGRVEPSTRDLR